MQLFLWFQQQRSTVYLLTALACFSAATCAMLELSLMHATSIEAYGEILRWQNLAVYLLLIPLVWGVYLHLGTARRWLALLITLLWSIAIVINFASPTSITFAEIQTLQQQPTFWGETFIGADGIRNPWVNLADLSSILIFIYFVDAAVRSWRLGRRQRALMVGIGAVSFILIGGIHAPLVDAGIIETPYLISFAFLTMVFALSYELVVSAVQAARYAREIEARDKRWDSLVSNMQLSLIGINSEGHIDYVNPFFERVSDYASDELIGQPMTRIVPASDAAELKHWLDIVAAGEHRVNSQWTILCRSGERRQFACSTVRLVSLQGVYEGMVIIAENITDRLRVEYELTTARREMERLMRASMLGELVSGLAHELNQPLTAVLSNAQAAQRLLDSNRLEAQELREILSDIVRDDQRASEVIARIRSMVRKGEAQREPIQINHAVQVVIDLMQGELEAQSISLDLALDPDLSNVVANQVEIQQVVMNLMMNAVRAVEGLSKDQRRISVETTQWDRGVKMVVKDSGVGITEDVARRMFQPFFTTKPTGIGVGLTICQRIVEAHGGQIWVAQRDTGCTRIAVQLPLGPVNK